MKRLFIACACAAMMCSCYTSRILVGDVQPKEPMIEVSKKHDAHFIGGLVKTAKEITEEHVGDAPNFAIHTKYGFGDMLLSFLTVGIYTPTTTKYYIPIRHMDNFTPVEKVKRGPRPLKTRGFTLMLDGAVTIPPVFGVYSAPMIGGVGSITLGYRINPHLFVGIGGRAGNVLCSASSEYYVINSKGVKTTDMSFDDVYGESFISEGFLRFRYTMLNKRCSPYINMDGSFGAYMAGVHGYSSSEVFGAGTKFLTWSVTPSLGGQFRLGGNTYFNMDIGYRFGENLKNKAERTTNDRSTRVVTWKMKPQELVFSLGLSFTM